MTFFERCRSFTVKVSGGSGVIFQPMTDEYSYILTAKHNLYNDPDTMKEAKKIIEIEACNIEINFNQSNKYEHETLDIAILKIDKVDIDTPFKEFEKLSKDLQYEFYGYPKYKRDESDEIEQQIENYAVNYSKQDASLVTFDNPKFAKVEEIIGASGGGVFREEDGKIYLVAIEYEMNAKEKSKATHERIDFRAVEAFDEIIENNKELVPLYPSYMNDFSLLLDDIFILNSMDDIKVQNLIRNEFKYLARELSKKFKPIDIKKKFENDLLVYGQDINEFTNKELWSMYLEFLLISMILDNSFPLNIDTLEDINKKRKFLFAKSNKWILLKPEILKSNLYELGKNGTVVICCDGDRRPRTVKFSGKTLSKIDNVPHSSEMRIDKGIDYSEDFKYKHICIVESNIEDECDTFEGVRDINILEKIREVISNVID